MTVFTAEPGDWLVNGFTKRKEKLLKKTNQLFVLYQRHINIIDHIFSTRFVSGINSIENVC